MADLDALLAHNKSSFAPEVYSKARHASAACQAGAPRVHIINCWVDQAPSWLEATSHWARRMNVVPVFLPRPPSASQLFPMSDFEILYEDGPCLVICKPAGVLTQAPPGIDSLEVRIKEFLRQRGGAAEDVYLGVPHRLDRPASGSR